jgi:hypothetical protein
MKLFSTTGLPVPPPELSVEPLATPELALLEDEEEAGLLLKEREDTTEGEEETDGGGTVRSSDKCPLRKSTMPIRFRKPPFTL